MVNGLYLFGTLFGLDNYKPLHTIFSHSAIHALVMVSHSVATAVLGHTDINKAAENTGSTGPSDHHQ